MTFSPRTFVVAVVAILLVLAGLVYGDPKLVGLGVDLADDVPEVPAPKSEPDAVPVPVDADAVDTEIVEASS